MLVFTRAHTHTHIYISTRTYMHTSIEIIQCMQTCDSGQTIMSIYYLCIYHIGDV